MKTCPEVTLKYKKGTIERIKLQSSFDVYNFAKKVFNSDTIDYQEEMIVVHLNKRLETISWHKTSVGGMSATICDPKIIFTGALLSGASSILIMHNHPSGGIRPSKEDDKLTNNIVEGGKLLSITVVDHMIITSDNGYYSYADEGRIF